MRSLRRRRASAGVVTGDTLTPSSSETSAGARLLRTLAERPTWCVDAVESRIDGPGQVLVFRGWALAPDAATPLGLAVDGVRAAEVVHGVARPDLARLFWYLPHAANAGFELTVERRPTATSGEVRLSLVVDGSIDERLDYWYPLDAQELPDAAHRRRVHGSDDAAPFLLEGRSAFHKLRTSLAGIGRDLDDVRSVLDWGCGCGRLTRHLAPLAARGTRVAGIDIDAMNVGWARDHLRFGTFAVVDTTPPTSLEPASFDLIVGISIFTHLREHDQLAWLAELRRLLADDGVAWVTIHGPTTMARAGVPSAGVREWSDVGFADIGINFDIAGAVGDDTYYRNVFHTHEYVRRVWSRWFEIVDIVPGYIGNNQDLVIMRPR